MQVSLLVDSARRDSWHEGNNRVEGPALEASSVLLVSSLRFGIHDGFEGRISVPFAWMKAKDPGGEASNSGVGDFLAELRWNRFGSNWRYGISVGSYWPLGELSSQSLPATATFSTGTVDPTFGGYLSGPPLSGFSWNLASTVRLVISNRSDDHRLGSSITSGFTIDRKLTTGFAGQLQLIYFHRKADSGPVMEPSGGNWLYMSPAASYRLFADKKHSLQATLAVRIPLLQDVVGRQLVESTSLNFGLGYTVEL